MADANAPFSLYDRHLSLVQRASYTLEAAYITLQRNESNAMWGVLMQMAMQLPSPRDSVLKTLAKRSNQQASPKPPPPEVQSASSSPTQSQQRLFALLRKCDTLERAIAVQRTHMTKVIGERDEVVRLWRRACDEISVLKEELVWAAEQLPPANVAADVLPSKEEESRTVSAALTTASSIVPGLRAAQGFLFLSDRNTLSSPKAAPTEYPVAANGSNEAPLHTVPVLSPNVSVIGAYTSPAPEGMLGPSGHTKSVTSKASRSFSASASSVGKRSTITQSQSESAMKTKLVFTGGKAPSLLTRKEHAAVHSHNKHRKDDPLSGSSSTVHDKGASFATSIGKWEAI